MAQGVREATNLGIIAEQLCAEGCRVLLVADIHFRSEPAFEALEHMEKVRINPGNFLYQKASLDDETVRAEVAKVFGRFVREAQARHRTIRIDVNHGSLSERILARYGNTPEGMATSCMEYLEVCDSLRMRDVVISTEASNVLVMTQVVRLLVERMDALDLHYPPHLGTTEVGAGEDGHVKSCIDIASLLVDSLGDTLRVSLSEEPEAGLRSGKKLIAYIGQLTTFDQTRLIYGSHTYRSVTRSQAQGAKEELAKYPAVLTLDSNGKTLDAGFDARLGETQLAFAEERQTPQVINLDTPVDRLVQHLEDFVTHWDGHSWLELRGTELDYIYKIRCAVDQLLRRGAIPHILLYYVSYARGYDDILIDCVTQLDSLLLEGIGNAVVFSAVATGPKARLDLLNGILQAVRIKMTYTEFIGCPGCGRTLFDPQQTAAQVKQRLVHLPSLGVGVTGCIVNGPGEMVDVDYGYVGGGVGKVDLYRGQEQLVHGIPSAEAVDHLIGLIKSDGKWCDLPQQ